MTKPEDQRPCTREQDLRSGNHVSWLITRDLVRNRASTGILLLLSFFCLGWKNPFTNKVKMGNDLFLQGKLDDALKEYLDAQLDNPESEILHFNIGNILFRQEKYKEAEEEYQKALQAKDISTQAKAYYNSGNCRFREKDLTGAIKYYKKALDLNPDDQEAKFNLEVARKKLKEMAQKSQPNQEQTQDSSSSEKQDGSGQSKSEKKEGDDRQGQSGQSAGKDQQQEQREREVDRPQGKNKDRNEQEKEEAKEMGSAQDDPNQKTALHQPGEAQPQGQGQTMSREDALRILQTLEGREAGELKYVSPVPSEEKEYIEYDW
ncbi:MAG: tetratricopeptide repeat protein [bacterium]